jgi:hypothetical protein
VSAAAQAEDAVRRYFESHEREAAGGTVRVLDDAAAASGLPLPDRTVIKTLAVESCGDDEARLIVDGVQEFVLPSGRGRSKRVSISIAGPVLARRRSGEWRVEDHTVAGRSISSSYSPVRADPVLVDAVSVELRSVLLGSRNVIAFLRVDNAAAERVTIRRAILRSRHRTCFGTQTREVVDPGARSQLALGWWKSLPSETRELSIEIEALVGERRHDVTWRVDPVGGQAQASTRAVGAVRAALRNPWLPWVVAALSLAAFAALTGRVPVSPFILLGLLLAYVGLQPLLQRLRRG